MGCERLMWGERAGRSGGCRSVQFEPSSSWCGGTVAAPSVGGDGELEGETNGGLLVDGVALEVPRGIRWTTSK